MLKYLLKDWFQRLLDEKYRRTMFLLTSGFHKWISSQKFIWHLFIWKYTIFMSTHLTNN